MENTVERKIIKVQKKREQKNVAFNEKIYDEDGQELEFEDSDVDDKYHDEEIVVQRDEEEDEEGWEDDEGDIDEDEDIDMNGKPKGQSKKEVWDESKAPLQEGEELVFDNSAYQMLHRAKVEWPCLSLDVILRDRVG